MLPQKKRQLTDEVTPQLRESEVEVGRVKTLFCSPTDQRFWKER